MTACAGDPTTTDTAEAPPADTSATTSATALDDTPPVLAAVDGFGYTPRACGFDLDDDGLIGEPEDDCRVCHPAVTDPDGDGVDEVSIYVDCDAGRDAPDCGSADSPCASLSFAWGPIASSRADENADGESIVCFRGTCREDAPLSPAVGGAEGTVEVAAGDGRARAFERPANPTMLVGWDTDGDREYPPVDRDDVAVLTGDADRAIVLDARHDRVELAHFTVRGHGRASDAEGRGAKNTGFLGFGPNQGELDHVHVHDLHLVDVNRGRATASEVSAINLFAGKTRLRWLWIDNVWAPRNGGWFVHG
ncbi:MAG: hypothetical protein AAGE94_20705, partial [Acidobacteriota bacterium]